MSNYRILSGVLTCLLFSILYYCNAYLCDDAVITYRTIDNFVRGYGLRWNIEDRVQVFTSPLHTAFIIPFYWLFNNLNEPPSPLSMYFVSIFTSFLLSISTIMLLHYVIRNIIIFWIVFLLFLFSQSFVTFFSSGLETPLIYLLTTLFLSVFLCKKILEEKDVWLLLFIASLAVVTRIDTALILFPASIYIVFFSFRNYGKVTIKYIFIGAIPLFLWFGFSLIYFGFLFPNSYFAKIGFNIDPKILFSMGIGYLEKCYKYDSATLVIICIGLILSLKSFKLLTIGIGLLIYVLYIVKIGGDFIDHRFLATPFLIATLVIADFLNKLELKRNRLIQIFLCLLITNIAYTSYNPYSPVLRYWNSPPPGDVNYYWHSSRLANWRLGKDFPFWNPIIPGFHALDYPDECHQLIAKTRTVGLTDGGIRGFCRGPKYHIVSYLSITDPLIARLPIDINDHFIPGHVRKLIPDGYLESLRSNRNLIKDSKLAIYYDKLKSIINGPIWSLQRWKYIYEFNFTSNSRFRFAYIVADPQPEEDAR